MTRIDYKTQVTTLGGKARDLSAYEGKVMLIVNTASECGLTPQYQGLEALHKAYGDKGLAVLGFPCNQFGGQEPGTEAEIAEFCQLNYGVSFDMHGKIDVNGEGTHPLYEQLKVAAPGKDGALDVQWNFAKFLVGRDGEIIRRFSPMKAPADLNDAIEAALAGP